MLALFVVPALLATTIAFGAQAQAPSRANAPWYPSLQAFEHYDSGRSHVFSEARFRGSFHGPNTVEEDRSAEGAYPATTRRTSTGMQPSSKGGSYEDVAG